MKRKSTQKTTAVTALTARTQLGQIMQRAAQKRERFLVGRRGQPIVMIMSIEDYVDSRLARKRLEESRAHGRG
jgi:prevent-host-death family protein